MTIEIQFVDFPKSPEIRQIIEKRFSNCLDHLKLGNEFHLNLVFKHVHLTKTELKIVVSGDKVHENVHVLGTDVPHTIEEGIKKLESILRKISDKLKAKHHAGRERRGHKNNPV